MPPFSVAPKAAPNKATSFGQSPSVKAAKERALNILTTVPGSTPAANVNPPEGGAASAGQSTGVTASPAESESPITENAGAASPTAVEPKKAESPSEEQPALAAQHAQLARKEMAMRKMVRDMKAREDALKAREEALNPPKAPSENFDPSKHLALEDFKKNPWQKLQEIGVSYDELTQQALSSPKPEEIAIQNTINELKAEISALKQANEKSTQSFEESKKAQYDQAVRQITNDVKQLVNSGEEYEMIKTTGSIKDVVDLIEKTFSEGLDEDRPAGTVLTNEEAAGMIEDYLLEEALKIVKAKKIQARLKPAEAPKSEAQTGAESKPDNTKQPDVKQSQNVLNNKTLSNAMSGSRKLSGIERAKLAFRGELKG